MPDSGGKSNEETNEEMEEEPLLFCRETLACEMAIECAYYPSGKNGTKGGRAKVKHICFNCYSEKGLTEDRNVEEKCNRGGRSYLQIWMGCLNANVPVSFRKGNMRNLLQAIMEKKRMRAKKKVAHKRRRN